MYFTDSTRLIRIKLAGAVTTNELPVVGAYHTITVNGFSVSAATPIHTVSNGTTTVTIVPSPSAGSISVLKALAIQNADTAAATVTVEAYDSTNARTIIKAALAVGDNLFYEDSAGWLVIDANSNIKQQLVTHTLLGSTLHSDTTTAGVSRGDIITGQGASTTWSRLAVGSAGQSVQSDGTDVTWRAIGAVNLYTSGDTWTKRAGANVVFALVIGGGGGGGSGRKGAAGSTRNGGGGGAGGGIAAMWFPASILGATETITIGAGGTGGAAQSTNSTNGNAGTNGGHSSFGSWLIAAGGGRGLGGDTAVPSALAGTNAWAMMEWITSHGAGSEPGTDASDTNWLPGGGGGGGGISSTDVATAGGAGGDSGFGTGSGQSAGFKTATTGGAGGATSTNGTAGSNVAANTPSGGGGGGGGGASKTTNAGDGANGGTYGGGGGGGGAALNAVGNSGAGGTGGAGFAMVIQF